MDGHNLQGHLLPSEYIHNIYHNMALRFKIIDVSGCHGDVKIMSNNSSLAMSLAIPDP
jgi:hypothetical protein